MKRVLTALGFACLMVVSVFSVTLGWAQIPQISDQKAEQLDQQVQDVLKAKGQVGLFTLPKADVRQAIEHGLLVKMKEVCGMDAENEFRSFIIQGMKKSWLRNQLLYVNFLQKITAISYDKELSAQGCTSEMKDYIAQNSLDRNAEKFTFPFPGQTLAAPLLQRDALMMVMVAAAGKNKACDLKTMPKDNPQEQVFVANTHVVSMPKPSDLTTSGLGPWKEVWTVNACGSLVTLPIRFMPDPKGKGSGTMFSIGVSDKPE